MARYEDLPYRTCVGMMLINTGGLVFIGRRAGGIEQVDDAHIWQMPQGGVDPGEDTWEAAKRELYEETNIRSVEKLGSSKEWLCYDIPPEIAGQAWNGKYRGQCQQWYALRFTGKESETAVSQSFLTRLGRSAGRDLNQHPDEGQARGESAGSSKQRGAGANVEPLLSD